MLPKDAYLEQASLACAWHEPFVLHYERPPPRLGGSPYKQPKDSETRFFTVELFLPEVTRLKGADTISTH